MSNKYYWIKLKTDFFNQREVKKLRKIAGGDTYTIIYLKLQLLSAKTDGIIKFDGTERDLVEQLELELDEDRDNINVTLSFLEANNLMEQINNTDYILHQTCDNIGKEGSSAERVRRHREKQKVLQCNVTSENCNVEIEKEKELEKKKEKDTDNITPKKCIDLYKNLISNEQGNIREQTSFNQLVLLKDDLEKIYLGIENFHKSKMPFTYSLPNFLKDKIYLDYQEVKVYSKSKNNQSSQLTEEDLERFGFNKPSEISSLGVVPWIESNS